MISKKIRDEGPKGVQAQIQGDQLRVTGKKRDDLQAVIALLKAEDFERRPAVHELPVTASRAAQTGAMNLGTATLLVGGVHRSGSGVFGVKMLVTGRAPAAILRNFPAVRAAALYHLLFGVALLLLVLGQAVPSGAAQPGDERAGRPAGRGSRWCATGRGGTETYR